RFRASADSETIETFVAPSRLSEVTRRVSALDVHGSKMQAAKPTKNQETPEIRGRGDPYDIGMCYSRVMARTKGALVCTVETSSMLSISMSGTRLVQVVTNSRR